MELARVADAERARKSAGPSLPVSERVLSALGVMVSGDAERSAAEGAGVLVAFALARASCEDSGRCSCGFASLTAGRLLLEKECDSNCSGTSSIGRLGVEVFDGAVALEEAREASFAAASSDLPSDFVGDGEALGESVAVAAACVLGVAWSADLLAAGFASLEASSDDAFDWTGLPVNEEAPRSSCGAMSDCGCAIVRSAEAAGD